MNRSLLVTGCLSLFVGLLACQKAPEKKTETVDPDSDKALAMKGASSLPAGPSSSKGLSAEARNDVDDDGVVRRGLKLTEAKALQVSEVFAQVDALSGKSVRVTGKVEKVCGKTGCWFSLVQEDKNIRITSKGYRYFVPTNAIGMTAVVEGDLEVRTLTPKQGQHLADDEAMATGKPAKKVETSVRELTIASVGLEMRNGG